MGHEQETIPVCSGNQYLMSGYEFSQWSAMETSGGVFPCSLSHIHHKLQNCSVLCEIQNRTSALLIQFSA